MDANDFGFDESSPEKDQPSDIKEELNQLQQAIEEDDQDGAEEQRILKEA